MEQAWVTVKQFLETVQKNPLHPLLRLLLTSDGTMVQGLSSLLLGPVSVDVLAQSEVVIRDEDAEQIGIQKGEKGIERKVWLSGAYAGSPSSDFKPEKLLFAVSVFPVSTLNPDLYQEIALKEKPIGQIISEQGFSTRRDRIQIACRPFPEIAREFALPEESLFWTRRYRLTISEQVSARICEVFSPKLSSFSS